MKCVGQNNGILGQGYAAEKGQAAGTGLASLPYINLGTNRTVVDFTLGYDAACGKSPFISRPQFAELM